MGQPVDFIGLNTFIYEACGYNSNKQVTTEGPQREARPLSDGSTIIHMEVLQNHIGIQPNQSDLFNYAEQEILNMIWYQFSIQNFPFPLELPDPTTGLVATTLQEKLNATASYFPALMMRRNGPYGWPTWKQIRSSHNPLIRKQRKNSIFTYVEEPGKEIQYFGPNGTLTLPQAFSDIKVYEESVVASKFKPVTILGSLESEFMLTNAIKIYATLGNEMIYFDNYQPNRYFGVSSEVSKYYKNIKQLYLNGRLQSPESDLQSFASLEYRETIYPAITNIYKNYTRFRPTFDFPWRDDIRASMYPGTSQTADEYYSAQTSPKIDNGFGFNVYYQNRWLKHTAWNSDSFSPETDSKYLVSGSFAGAKSFDDYQRVSDTRKSLDSSSIFFPPVGGARAFGESLSDPYSRRQAELTNSAGGDGQLMNTYSLFSDWRQVSNSSGYADSIDNFLTASAFYSRLHVIPSPYSMAHPHGMPIPETGSYVENDIFLPIEQNFGGSTKWQTNTTRKVLTPFFGGEAFEKRNPFADSYSDFSEYTRLVGKDYSLVPEFRISNHVENYLISNEIDGEDNGIFEISGGLESTSSSDVTEFYKIYSNSDFMKHFELVRTDHSGFIDPTAIALKCKIVKKFVPYEGFYPSQRCMQMAKQFYKSYGDYFENLESFVLEAEDPTQLTGEYAQAQIRLLGDFLYPYYELTPGKTTAYGDSYANNNYQDRGNRAPIANLSTEASSDGRSVLGPMVCECGSRNWTNGSGYHYDNSWSTNLSYAFYSHTDQNPNSPEHKSYRDNHGFILQDVNRLCVYVQLIDGKIWDLFTASDFFQDPSLPPGQIRNYMFPLADYGASGNLHRQPLLIKDTDLIFANPSWNSDWNQYTLAATTGNDHLPPTMIPVIWVRGDDDQTQNDHVRVAKHTARNIRDAIQALHNNSLAKDVVNKDVGPTSNLLHWFNRATDINGIGLTWERQWGYSIFVPGQSPTVDTTFPTSTGTGPASWGVSAAIINSIPSSNLSPEWDDHVIKFQDNSIAVRDEDQRMIMNFCYGISTSTSQMGAEFELSEAPTTPNHTGMWTLYNSSMINTNHVIQNSYGEDSSKYTRTQPFLTPLFAPGVLFNTIKAGVACDYPLMTDNLNRVLATVSSSQEGTASFWMIGSRTAATSSFIGPTDYNYFENYKDNPSTYTTNTALLGGDNLDAAGNVIGYLSSSHFRTANGELGRVADEESHNSYGVLATARNLNSNQFRGFNLRVPFEALLEPEGYLAHRAMVNQEPDNFLYFNKYLRISYKAFWDGQGDKLYKKMAHNFLAEVPEFFLKNGEFKSFKSLKQGDPNFGMVEGINAEEHGIDETTDDRDIIPKTYSMRLKMYRSTFGPKGKFWNNGVVIYPPQDWPGENPEISQIPTFSMYSRPSAFGPPTWDGYTNMSGNGDVPGNDNRMGYNFPFTPPYYHGDAWADITFKPNRIGKHTLDEIIASSSVEYYRYWHPRANLAMKKMEGNANTGAFPFYWTNWTGSLANQTSSLGFIESQTMPNGEAYSVQVDGNWYGPQHPLFVNDNAMQLDASLNIFSKEENLVLPEEILDDGTIDATGILSTIDQNESKWAIQTKFETPMLNFMHVSASGQQQIIEIDVADYFNNKDNIDTDGGTAPVTFTYGPQSFGPYTYNQSIAYQDNRIVIYDGITPYHIWFANTTTENICRTFLPNTPFEITICESTDFEDADPSTEGYGNTIKVDITSCTSDVCIRSRLQTALENHTPFGVTLASNSTFDTRLRITSSMSGPSNAPILSSNLSTIASTYSLVEPFITTSGSYDSGSMHYNKLTPVATTRGMWHQYGVVPNPLDGVFLSLSDVPKNWQKGALGVHQGWQECTGSLCDLVGFPKDRVKLGEMHSTNIITEAIVAVPFIVDNGERKFFEIPRRDIEDAMATYQSDSSFAGHSIRQMVQKMKRYVFPPQFDFLNREELIPFAMYIFEFQHTLTEQDLCDIWQGLPPKIGVGFDDDVATISHNLLSSELLGGGSSSDTPPVPASRNKNPGLRLNDKIRWMVFKAKKRAKTNYYQKVIKKPNITDWIEAISGKNITFNWPYDFFSLVELVKIDAAVQLSQVEEVDDVGSTEVSPQTESPTGNGPVMIRVKPDLAHKLAAPIGSAAQLLQQDQYGPNPEEEEI